LKPTLPRHTPFLLPCLVQGDLEQPASDRFRIDRRRRFDRLNHSLLKNVVHKMRIAQHTYQECSQIPLEFHACLLDKSANFDIMGQRRSSDRQNTENRMNFS
jgi:hypothetical protein